MHATIEQGLALYREERKKLDEWYWSFRHRPGFGAGPLCFLTKLQWDEFQIKDAYVRGMQRALGLTNEEAAAIERGVYLEISSTWPEHTVS